MKGESEDTLHDMNEEIKDRVNIGIIDEKELQATLKKIVCNPQFHFI